MQPWPLVTRRVDVLPQDLVKPRCREIRVYTFSMALIFDRHLGSNAAEMPVKFQGDTFIITSYLVASRIHEIGGKTTSARLENGGRGYGIAQDLFTQVLNFWRFWPALRAGLLCCNFFGQPGSVSKFPPLLWVKLWVGWVGRGYTEISRYFPASWINWVTLVTKIKLLYSLRF